MKTEQITIPATDSKPAQEMFTMLDISQLTGDGSLSIKDLLKNYIETNFSGLDDVLIAGAFMDFHLQLKAFTDSSNFPSTA